MRISNRLSVRTMGLFLAILVLSATCVQAQVRTPVGAPTVTEEQQVKGEAMRLRDQVAAEKSFDAVEPQFLALLEAYPEPDLQGIVLSEMVLSFGHLREKDDAKTKKYAEEALKRPLDLDTHVSMLLYLAGATSGVMGEQGVERSAIRSESTAIKLEALRKLLEAGVPAERLPLPEQSIEMAIHMEPDNQRPGFGMMRTAEQAVDNRRVVEMNTLIGSRQRLEENIPGSYVAEDSDPEELRAAVLDALGSNYADLADQMVARVYERREEREQARIAGQARIDAMAARGELPHPSEVPPQQPAQ